MNPGRELDALVAEKVMGCRLIPHVNPKYSPTCGCENRAHRIREEISNDLLAEYSTDISAAWQVVEKMSLFGGTGCSLVGPLPGQKWHIHFGKISSDSVIGDTAPHAICLAALKAVGVNLEVAV